MKKLIMLLLVLAFLAGGHAWWEHNASAGPPDCTVESGDVDANGTTDISDAVKILGHLFLGDPAKTRLTRRQVTRRFHPGGQR